MVVQRSALRSFDAFAKPVEGLRTQTTVGGIITLLASSTAAILFLSQLYLYAQVSTRQSFQLAESTSTPALLPPHQQRAASLSEIRAQRKSRIQLFVHVTFPHIKCRDLDYAHDNASLSNREFHKVHGSSAFSLRPPSQSELDQALGGRQNARGVRRNDACTVTGSISVPKVGGSLTVTVSRRAWQQATSSLALGFTADKRQLEQKIKNMHNTSHYVHDIAFGDVFPLAPNPLKDAPQIIKNDFNGAGLANIAVKLIPTRYKRFARKAKDTYQVSVSQHIVAPNVMAAQHSQLLPGIALTYDFTPLAVHHVESRENIAVFISSLVSIVGGVFVTVGLVSSCLVNSAAAVAKKMD